MEMSRAWLLLCTALTLAEGRALPWSVDSDTATPARAFVKLRAHLWYGARSFMASARRRRQAKEGGVFDAFALATAEAARSDVRPVTAPGLGRHAADYMKRAAIARSSMMDEALVYGFATAKTGRPSSAPVGANSSTKPLRIAQYSYVYGPSPVWSGNFTECDNACVAVGEYGDVDAAATADVVVVNLMSPHTPWPRPPGQLWVGTYFESPDHYPTLRSAAVLAAFNYTTGYRPDADFPLFNMVQDTAQLINRTRSWPLPSHAVKRGRPMMSTWISNCQVESLGRLKLLDQLVQHNVSLASYGKCGPGQARAAMGPGLAAQWQRWAVEGGPGAEKAAVSAQHLFMYAAENSGCAYYTTEKIFHALVGGSVPVYLGEGASLKRLLPPHSVIYAADFAGPASLAQYLHHLAVNTTAYEAYLSWRADPTALDVLNKLMSLPAWEATHAESKACALCEFLWAAPRRVEPLASTDLCQPLNGRRKTRFALRRL